MDDSSHNSTLSRRQFINTTAGLAAAQMIPTQSLLASNTKPSASAKRVSKLGEKKNILFIFTDQERFFPTLPNGYRLPGHEYLAKRGTTFTSHHISATMCTSSRATMLTGLQSIDNKMFDNTDMPYVKPLSKKIPTIGHMLQKAGYYPVYKGKWHLDPAFENHEQEKLLLKEMEEYGFHDFYSLGDSIAHAQGGYNFDHLTAGNAVTWLRRKGRPMTDEGKPWALTVSLINPHDIMYFNADAPGENIQDTGNLMMRAARAPEHADFQKTWNMPIAKNLRQTFDEKGRPAAHGEFNRAWGFTLGSIPLVDANWRRFTDYYLNSIKLADAHLMTVLNELEALGLTHDTTIIFTADHGEMGGHHGLRGKGPFAYKEAIHVPFYVVHPDVAGGAHCNALTSHIDLAPTILSLAGVEKGKVAEFAKRDLPGCDLSGVISSPKNSKLDAARDKVLFTYSGIATNDSDLIKIVSDAKAKGKNPKLAVVKEGYKPNMKKRGSVRTVYDGRHKFSRYFGPMERNQPSNIEELFKFNDVELYDLKTDNDEMKNLATDQVKNKDLILAMNAKLESAIKKEMGKDDGREMPHLPGINWTIDRLDL